MKIRPSEIFFHGNLEHVVHMLKKKLFLGINFKLKTTVDLNYYSKQNVCKISVYLKKGYL